MHLPFKVFPQHNSAVHGIFGADFVKGTKMKKLALGLVIAAFASGVFAQTETAGGAAAGAGGAAGVTVVTTNALLVTAGVVAAGAVAAGSKAPTTTNH